MPVGAKCADGHRSCCKTDPKISVCFAIVTDNVTFRIFGLTAENAREGTCREKGGNASGKGKERVGKREGTCREKGGNASRKGRERFEKREEKRTDRGVFILFFL